MRVVSDTSPLNYLVLIEHAEILPALFGRVVVPHVVRDELSDPGAPDAVRAWIAAPPSWLDIAPAPNEDDDPELRPLDDGERAAIRLAASIGAELVLIDDREAVGIARRKGFDVTGTLGVLDLAAGKDLIQMKPAIERLKTTTFRYPPKVVEALLRRHSPPG